MTVMSSQIWSLFLLRLISSFVYFREILPREQVMLWALTQSWSQDQDSKQQEQFNSIIPSSGWCPPSFMGSHGTKTVNTHITVTFLGIF